jgi:hypothetical protein
MSLKLAELTLLGLVFKYSKALGEQLTFSSNLIVEHADKNNTNKIDIFINHSRDI